MDHDTKASANFGQGPSFVTRVRLLDAGWRRRVVVISLVLSDVSLALLLWGFSRLFRAALDTPGDVGGVALATLGSSLAVWISLRALLGLYPGYGLDSVELLRRHTYSVFAALAVLSLFALGFQVGELLSRLLLGLSFLGLLFFGPFVRKIVTSLLRAMWLWGKPVIVLSYKGTGERFIELLRTEWGLGYLPVALFNYNLIPAGESFEDAPYEQTLMDAVAMAQSRGIDTAIFALPHTRRAQLAHMVSLASESFPYVLVIPNLGGVTNSAVIARDLAGTFAVEIKHNLLNPWARRLKRALDLFGALVGGLLISPLLIVIALLIKLDSPGPVLYGHRRLGERDEHFSCLKFRTMSKDAESRLEDYLQENPTLRAEWEENQKLRNDPRVTRIGRILRKTSLDELPQLFNVLTGEMSLIGPRPIVDGEVMKYQDAYDLYRRIRPGMSGFWQVSGRSDTNYDERVDMDTYYVRNWSVWLDIVILARTVKIVLRGGGAY